LFTAPSRETTRSLASLRRAVARYRASRQLQAFVEGRVAAHRRGHQEAVAFAEDALDIVGIDVGWPTTTLCSLQVLTTRAIHLSTSGCSYCRGVTKFLGQIAFADEDRADAGHLS
jgi:hypothetical protein